MSIETTDKKKLSPEEKAAKKLRKAEKKRVAETSAAATAPLATSTTVESTPDPVSRKDKKRKDRESEAGDKSAKKEKKEKEQIKSAAETPVEVPTPSTDDAAPAPALSKKQLKKLARAAAASSSSSSATDATPSSTPALAATPGPFTPEHEKYLTTHDITLTPHLYPPQLSIPDLPIATVLKPFLKQYTTPTPIQSCSWPPLLALRDVVGIAETGSGKTLSFGVPGLNRLANESRKKGKVAMLVIAPTRELAQQSHVTLSAFGEQAGLSSICIFGGVGKDEQIQGIKKAAVVVGTPGRLLDLADSGDLDLSQVKYLVLDEADRMLDQGFENDIRRIIAHCPDKTAGRQTVMFSATWPDSVRRLASTFLNDPVKITVGSDELSANKRIEQIVEVLEHHQKDPRMLHHLRSHLKAHPSSPASPTRILVFALYKKEAQRLEGTIRRNGFTVGALHGDMDQNARFRALDNFKDGKVNILVATDVAARGLDIPDVELVLNVTFPLTTEDFVHRCGRTGRAGKSGRAVTFFTGENHERSLAGEFMRVLRDVGAEIPKEMDQFPSTIKKKEHGSYGAFYKDTTNAPKATKITFD